VTVVLAGAGGLATDAIVISLEFVDAAAVLAG
jgi:hypothetical protein